MPSTLQALDELLDLGRRFPMSDADQRHFENILFLRAAVLGWTGDPLKQPPTSVLAAYKQMLTEKGVSVA